MIDELLRYEQPDRVAPFQTAIVTNGGFVYPTNEISEGLCANYAYYGTQYGTEVR
ncbi:unnamed protein product [Ectocarpus sp. CCAP 1310/34]|nr:unnamed protein product [Ectocarpus sp. CCAP 1310/34]